MGEPVQNLEAATPTHYGWIDKKYESKPVRWHQIPEDLDGRTSGLTSVYCHTQWSWWDRLAVRLTNGQVVLIRPKVPGRA